MLPSTETFGIPELLEMILEIATPKDLLLWQRVNTKWHATIQRSPRIQEKLFFRARPCKNAHEQKHAVLNPFMDLFFVKDYRSRPTSLCPIANDVFDGKASYPTASWKLMFTTSPALTDMSITCADGKKINIFSNVVLCRSGITIGQLVDSHEKESVPHADYYKRGPNRFRDHGYEYDEKAQSYKWIQVP